MPVRIRPQSPPVNRVLVTAALALGLAYTTMPDNPAGIEAYIVPMTAGAVAALLALRGMNALIADYRLRRNLAISQLVSEDHGSAREATRIERVALGMDAPRGDLLGLDRGNHPVWRPRNAPFGLIEMPPGVGKTISYVVPSILHRALSGYSVVVSDPKNELYPMLAGQLRALGFEVWGTDPAAGASDDTNVELNPYQALIDAVHGEGEERRNAVKIAADYAAIHYPLSGDEKNPYFVHGSQRVIIVVIVSQAFLDPADCTPAAAYSLITDPSRLLKRLTLCADNLEALDPSDAIVEFLRTEARNLLHRAAKNEENFAAFLEGASQRLLAFNPAGHLGAFGKHAVRRVREVRERQIIFFIRSRLSHAREFAGLTSLLNHNLIAACKATPTGHKVHFVVEEALNYRFHELTSDLETMRGLGVSADFYIQSFAGLEKVYGREAARAIESYADVRIYAGINSYERAKFVSDMLSDTTLRAQDYSYQSAAKDIGISSRELGRPLMKPNEILTMERGRAWVFVRGLHPMNLRMVHYGEVDPWRDWVAANPLTGDRLRAEALVRVSYPEIDEDA